MAVLSCVADADGVGEGFGEGGVGEGGEEGRGNVGWEEGAPDGEFDGFVAGVV